MTRQLDDRLLESWLAEGPSELPDRVIHNILDNLEEKRGPWWLPGRKTMNRMMFAVGGIAVLAIALAATGVFFGRDSDGPPGAGGQPTPTLQVEPPPTPTPTTAPSPVALRFGEQEIAPGTYSAPYQGLLYTFTAPAPGMWFANLKSDSLLIIKDLGDISFAGLLVFGQVNDLPADACDWNGSEAAPGESVEDFATALSEVSGLDSSAPADVTVDGYQGKRIQMKVPDDVNFDACDNGEYHGINGWYNFAQGQTYDVWVLDVDGTRTVYMTVYDPNTPDATVDELAQLADSLQIDPLAR